MTDAIGKIGGKVGLGETGKVQDDDLFKFKKEEPQVAWVNGFNTNQIGGLLNGSLSATASNG